MPFDIALLKKNIIGCCKFPVGWPGPDTQHSRIDIGEPFLEGRALNKLNFKNDVVTVLNELEPNGALDVPQWDLDAQTNNNFNQAIDCSD